MKFFTLSIALASLLLVGCGGSDSKKSNSPETSNTPSSSNTIEEAKTNLKAFSAFTAIDISSINPNKSNKQLKALQKETSGACKDGGSFSFDTSEDEKTQIIAYDNCKINTATYNGTVTISGTDENNQKIEISEFTYTDVAGEQYMNITMEISQDSNNVMTASLDGTINQTTSSGEINNMTLDNFLSTSKTSSSESWITLDGGISLESKCFTGNFTFETIEKLIDAKDGTENLESGILKINTATYTFENPEVTIKTGSGETTMLQSELEKELETEIECKS